MPEAATRVVLGLGANVGDPAAQLDAAVRRLAATPGIRVVAVSGRYRTRPIGPPQPDYVNAAALIETALAPHDLLAACQAVETAGARERAERWGPRTIDVDVLWWEGRAIDEPDLVVPHPRLLERRFALEPLVELVPAAALPDGTLLGVVCAALPDQGVLRLRDG